MSLGQTLHRIAQNITTQFGESITFTKVVGTYTPGTGAVASTTTTVTGVAVQVSGNARRYKELNLVVANSVTLMFTPTTYGQRPDPGATFTWGSVDYVVRDVSPISADDTPITVEIIGSK